MRVLYYAPCICRESVVYFPQNMRKDKLKLLIHGDLRHAASRDMLSGFLRYAAIHPEWEVQIEGGHPSSASLEHYHGWKPDALVTNDYVRRFSATEYRNLAGKFALYVNSQPRRDVRVPSAVVESDDLALASAAAEFFLSKALKSYAFVGSPAHEPWSERRLRFFRDILKKNGKPLAVFNPPRESNWKIQEDALGAWLKTLPAPCGLWAAYDQRAKHVLDACRLVGINVPSQIKVLGVDNESYICDQTLPRLSSIAPNFEEAGYQSFALIERAIRDPKSIEHLPPLKIGLRGIIERESTCDENGTARRIFQARDFIHCHASTPISIEDIARAVGVSVRCLQKDFHNITGHTILEELQQERLKIAQKLLRETSTKIDALPSFCGFNSASHLKALFKKTFGLTMSDYRNR